MATLVHSPSLARRPAVRPRQIPTQLITSRNGCRCGSAAAPVVRDDGRRGQRRPRRATPLHQPASAQQAGSKTCAAVTRHTPTARTPRGQNADFTRQAMEYPQVRGSSDGLGWAFCKTAHSPQAGLTQHLSQSHVRVSGCRRPSADVDVVRPLSAAAVPVGEASTGCPTAHAGMPMGHLGPRTWRGCLHARPSRSTGS
jgi:hypothetical protein